MKRVLLSLIVLACCAAVAQAELKVGYIDSEVLKERLPEFRDAQRKLDQLRQDYENQAKDREAKLLKLQEDFRRQELLMSEARKAELQTEFEAKVQQLQQFTQEKFGPEGELMRKNIELSEPIFKKINDAIQVMAEEENLGATRRPGGPRRRGTISFSTQLRRPAAWSSPRKTMI